MTECGVRPCRPFRIRERGSIFIYIIWVLMLLSLFAAGIGSPALFALNLSDRLSGQLQANYLARGAVPYAASILAADDTPLYDGLDETWAGSAIFQEHRAPGGTVSFLMEEPGEGGQRFGLVDEERRLNLNTAPEAVLKRLATLVGGLSDEDAVGVAASIADWRDPDTDQRSAGAEGFHYRTLTHAYDCKDGPFENVEELQLVKGVSPALYRRLEPHVTVYGSGAVNLNTAGIEVLRALGLSEPGVKGFMDFRAGNDTQAHTGDERYVVSVAELESQLKDFVPVEDLARLAALVKDKAIGASSHAFRTTIVANEARTSASLRAQCVLSRKGAILLWMER